MGIEFNEPAYIYGYNKSVISNALVPESVMRKKSNSISYNFVKEDSAMDEWRVAYVNTHEKFADLFNKLLGGEKRKSFVLRLLHHPYG